MNTLPQVLQEICEVAGLEAAIRIARRYGGSRMSIPAYPKGDHWLVETVGENAARKICDHYRIINGSDRAAGIYLDIPLGPAGMRALSHQRIRAYLADGLSADEVARRVGVHRQTVLRQAQKLRDPRQADLFED
ncbi:hypothetical protein PUV47_01330 [Pseudovibrio exalbescens]|uniref:hypothetical protein n=1 Tax=Pseudovibrio exalbescens TaxID=197461 RepID=UPI0023670023|nr:hypothetical protein [Pseudovibrio exalbescens]MDD7908543.1 hypothetical protein [Pseudovibrio exalbescens]